MAKTTIIIQTGGGGLEQYKDHASNLLYQYYQNSPSALIDIPLTPEELAEIRDCQVMAEWAGKGYDLSKPIPSDQTTHGRRT